MQPHGLNILQTKAQTNNGLLGVLFTWMGVIDLATIFAPLLTMLAKHEYNTCKLTSFPVCHSIIG